MRSTPSEKLIRVAEDLKRAIYKMRCKIAGGPVREVLEEVETHNSEIVQLVKKIDGALPAKKKGNIVEFQWSYDSYKQVGIIRTVI